MQLLVLSGTVHQVHKATLGKNLKVASVAFSQRRCAHGVFFSSVHRWSCDPLRPSEPFRAIVSQGLTVRLNLFRPGLHDSLPAGLLHVGLSQPEPLNILCCSCMPAKLQSRRFLQVTGAMRPRASE